MPGLEHNCLRFWVLALGKPETLIRYPVEVHTLRSTGTFSFECTYKSSTAYLEVSLKKL
jgi:hypothetical protein